MPGMSYVRFGENGSQVFVYLHVQGGIECCDCPLGECYWAHTAAEMADHLREHLAAGHVVPDGVIDRILANPDLEPTLDRPGTY